MSATKLTQYTPAEIKKHNKADDCWIVIDNKVYDLTDFLAEHPGGAKAPMIYAGDDATEEFTMLHKPSIIEGMGKLYLIGEVVGHTSSRTGPSRL